ncbi:GNAT family N-acetyltransferase [Antrihabitans cavernicola]|uniref:GNAT family N-acetyltransferase n=1 Tax=Antrihabitans cavernicola TaxID=2495913 RepID=A0A5A7SG50_9NOCA|nr:GNAT family N-acetyltransferase [Spelaeibacter cavernicola]KAA0023603.1 GNAT family N-acetyltransferase [Spelaeibacter cavernicola]
MAETRPLDVAPVPAEDYTEFRLVASRQFHADPIPDSPPDAVWRNALYESQRLTAAWSDGKIVATYRCWDDQLAVPGATLTADLISTVTVSPTHRRMGLLTAMIRPDLLRAKESGTAVAYLIAAAAPIYGRFGFGAAVEHARWTVDADPALFQLSDESASLTVELGDDRELRTIAPDVYDAAYRGAPGAIARDGVWWDGTLGLADLSDDRKGPRYTIVVRDETKTAVGYARYNVKESSTQRVDTSELTVHDLAATTPAAYARLWAFLASIDLTSTLTAGDRPVSEPLPWLLSDRRGARQSERADFGWIRILDVVAALEARRYATAGTVVLDVLDPSGLAGGTFALHVDASGTGRVAATDGAADLTLDMSTLGSAYLGQIALQEIANAGGIAEHTDGAIARLSALLWYPATGAVTLTWF